MLAATHKILTRRDSQNPYSPRLLAVIRIRETPRRAILASDGVVMLPPEPPEIPADTSREGRVEEEGRTHRENAFGDWKRFVWTLCAATSMVISKYLLVDLNFHYPLHLAILQLGAAGVITLYDTVIRRPWNVAAVTRTPNGRQWLFNVALSGPEALSLLFSTQAILHFPNLSTLAILPVNSVANRPRSRLILLSGFSGIVPFSKHKSTQQYEIGSKRSY